MTLRFVTRGIWLQFAFNISDNNIRIFTRPETKHWLAEPVEEGKTS